MTKGIDQLLWEIRGKVAVEKIPKIQHILLVTAQ
jgi:hypothetical protein